jgi:recombination protein RecR
MINKEIKQLIQQFAKLPTINSRQAKKIIAYLLENLSNNGVDSENLIIFLEKIRQNIHKCTNCGNILINEKDCEICYKGEKNFSTVVCVVENLYELWRISSLNNLDSYKFHILGGVISATNGISPDMLSIANLIQRIENEEITEVIIALNKSYNGSITVNYVANILKKRFNHLTISTFAGGLPSGTDLDFIDDKTLEIAMNSRVLC